MGHYAQWFLIGALSGRYEAMAREGFVIRRMEVLNRGKTRYHLEMLKI